MNIDVNYIQTRISEIGSTQDMTVKRDGNLIHVYEYGSQVGDIIFTGKTFKVFYKGCKYGGAFRSIDSAIERFKTEVKNQKYVADMKQFIG